MKRLNVRCALAETYHVSDVGQVLGREGGPSSAHLRGSDIGGPGGTGRTGLHLGRSRPRVARRNGGALSGAVGRVAAPEGRLSRQPLGMAAQPQTLTLSRGPAFILFSSLFV